MNRRGVARQRGLTLVELMISLVLGLVLVAAGFNMYLGSTRSARFSEGIQAMQESGRYGIGVLRQGIRLAGFSTSSELEPIDIASSSATSIAVRSQQDFDCSGLDTTPTDGIAVNTYKFDSANERIVCTGNQAGAGPMVLVEGVEAFRILYGIDEDDTDGVETPQRYIAYDATIDPDTISSLRFALLVNSGKAIRTRSRSASYVVLDQELSKDDRMAREVFSSTVLLRNR